jgi:integrase
MAISKTRLILAQELAKESPAFKNFMRGLSSDSAISDYTKYNLNFMDFHKLERDFDSLVKNDAKTISKMITDFLDSCLERGVKNATLRTYLMGIERMFIMNDCIWHKDRIRSGIGTDDEIPGGRVPIQTSEVWDMLQHTKSLRTKSLVHFIASTGMRPGALNDPILRIKHLEEMKTPQNQKCYAIKIYDGSKSGYWSFLTPEATKTLSRYIESRKIKGESINDESPLFHSQYRKENLDSALKTDFARVTMANLIKASGVKRVRVSKHSFDKSVMYMFRKRFNTILKLNNEVNSNIAEKLMAHKKGLDGTYLQPTKEECFAEFVKAIPDLTIDPTQRLKLENKKLESENQEIDDLKEKWTKDMKEHISKLESMIEEKNEPLTVDYMKLKHNIKDSTLAEIIKAIKKGEAV